MSRSKPDENNNPNPATKWIEWNGSAGHLEYYDKVAKENISLGDDFTFILLDQLGTVKGWHDPSESGIYSNEVKDTRQDVLVVKAFKGGVLAEGTYNNIKDRVKASGGKFVTNCYVAYKGDDGLKIASLQFSGAALSSWMDFSKENRADLFKKAVRLKGSTEGKKGSIKFKKPNFTLIPLTEETNAQAVELDKQLQEFLNGYLKRSKVQQAEQQAPSEESQDREYPEEREQAEPDQDIPF